MKFKLFFAGILLSVLPALNSCNGSGGAKRAGGDTEVTELRCRDLDDPEGVDRAVFSWQIESEADSIVQTAWEIEIASDEKALKNGKADVWSSGKQLSDQQLNVRPQGADLKPGERYWWRVRIWDGADRPTSWSDPASFSLGPAADQWQAKWITAQWEEGSPLPYFRTVFNADQPGTKPVRAVIYLSGLGCSDLFFNGRRVDSIPDTRPGSEQLRTVCAVQHVRRDQPTEKRGQLHRRDARRRLVQPGQGMGPRVQLRQTDPAGANGNYL